MTSRITIKIPAINLKQTHDSHERFIFGFFLKLRGSSVSNPLYISSRIFLAAF
jgi:hypothetical protein